MPAGAGYAPTQGARSWLAHWEQRALGTLPASGHEIQFVQLYLNNVADQEKIKRMPRALKLTSELSISIAKSLLEMGANLRLARERRGLSVRALAAEINVSMPGRHEHGAR